MIAQVVRIWRTSLAVPLGITAVLVTAIPASGAPGDRGACREVIFEGDRFAVCSYSPRSQELRLASRDKRGPIGDFRRLAEDVGDKLSRVDFAMNAGMFGADQSPIGLWIEHGRTVRQLNRRGGDGNFYLRPNGVFWVDRAGRPHITETSAAAGMRAAPMWATQSGPLLLERGALNAHVAPNGSSLTIRNGVCVRGADALFAISDGPVSFGRLARLFSDQLGCSDALYFDGAVSSLWAPALGRRDATTGLGTFVLVLGRNR